MASTYSTLKFELITTGEQNGTWGTTTNTNLGTAIEEAIVGRANAQFTSDADLTLTLSDTNATQVARNYILNVTSVVSLSTTRNLIVPTINKPYIVENNTSGSQSIVVKTSAGSGITVPNGKKAMVYANGTNVVADDYSPDLTVNTFTANSTATFNGNVALGDAGTDTTTVNSQLSANGSVGTSGQVLASRGSNLSPQWTTLSANSISQGDSNVTVTDAGTGAITLTTDGVTRVTINNNSGSGGTLKTNAYRDVTISTGAPTGGSDGDIWYRI